jgi:hypothetical protein
MCVDLPNSGLNRLVRKQLVEGDIETGGKLKINQQTN